MVTQYPAAIDGYSEIRFVLDRNTGYKIDARDHNDLRSAIIAIENTLGLNPQGPFGTVGERLSDAYANIALHASGSVPRHMDDDIDASAKAGSPNSLSSGTIETQFVELLDYINNLHETTGAALVGSVGFTTAKNNYTFSGSNVQAQIEEVGNFMDLNIDFLKKAFNSYIVEGLNITVKDISDLIVDVETGYISSQGVILNYLGAEDLNLLSTPGNGTFYVYAYRNLDNVVIRAINETGLSGVISGTDTICLLSEIIINGSEYSVLDMRRFGVFSNDKNGVTVGSAPVSGFDGYGCDFISLKAAAKFVSLCKDTGNLLIPNKITLVSDISIFTEAEAQIELIKGMEIDGSGNTIYYSAPTYLFHTDCDNVTIRNLNVSTNYSTTDWTGNGYFLVAAENSNIVNLKVLDCTVSSRGAVDLNSFITLCGSGTRQVNKLVVRNNNVAVGLSGVYHATSVGSISLIDNAIIDGNIFYQTTYSSTPSWSKAIVVGSYSKVSNNFIKGGYLTGIEAAQSVYTDIQGNTIIGENAATYYMNNGIVYLNASAVVSDNLISHNVIRGVNNYGINCKAGFGYLKVIGIDNNIIDNSASIAPPTGMVAVNSYYLSETTVSNNMILYPGASDGTKTINEATQVIGNYIYCVPQEFGLPTSILIYVVKPGVVVSQNVIKNSTGICIYIGAGSHGSIVSNNTIYETYSLGANCISAFDTNYLTITNNTIVGSYSEVRVRGGIYLENCNKASLSRNSINNIEGTAIYTNLACTGNVISNNIISDAVNGINCGLVSSEYIVKDNFIIYDSTYVIATENAIIGVGSNSVVEGNYIYNFGQSNVNYAISCRGIDKIQINNNVILGLLGNETIGIEASLCSNSKVNGNHINNTYLGINLGPYSEASNNKVYISSTNGIVTNGGFCSISGNYIYECVLTGISCSNDNVSIGNNYVYFSGIGSMGIGLSGTDMGSVTGNYINAFGVSAVLDIKMLSCVSCNETNINSNYIINNYTVSGSADAYGIYLYDSSFTSLTSNYVYCQSKARTRNICLADSRHNKITNNYLYYPGTDAISLEATSLSVGSNHIISGNYIFGETASAVVANGIRLNSATIANVNIVGNYIYLPSTLTGVTGMLLGDTINRAILVGSNMVRIGASATNKAVTFTTATGLKVIGNVAIGGVAPDGTIWSGGYVNSASDNVFVS